VTDSTTAAAVQNGVSGRWSVEAIWCVRILCCIVASLHRCIVGHWANRVTASETGEVELRELPRSGRAVTAVNPEMLQRAEAIIREDQPDNRCPVFQSAKEVLLTSTVISDVRRCARDGFLGATQSNTKPKEKPFLTSTVQPKSRIVRFAPIWSPEGTNFENFDGVIRAVRTCLREQDMAWYRQGIHTLIPRWRRAVEVDGDFVKK
jgi:hypothetical protein